MLDINDFFIVRSPRHQILALQKSITANRKNYDTWKAFNVPHESGCRCWGVKFILLTANAYNQEIYQTPFRSVGKGSHQFPFITSHPRQQMRSQKWKDKQWKKPENLLAQRHWGWSKLEDCNIMVLYCPLHTIYLSMNTPPYTPPSSIHH